MAAIQNDWLDALQGEFRQPYYKNNSGYGDVASSGYGRFGSGFDVSTMFFG